MEASSTGAVLVSFKGITHDVSDNNHRLRLASINNVYVGLAAIDYGEHNSCGLRAIR